MDLGFRCLDFCMTCFGREFFQAFDGFHRLLGYTGFLDGFWGLIQKFKKNGVECVCACRYSGMLSLIVQQDSCFGVVRVQVVYLRSTGLWKGVLLMLSWAMRRIRKPYVKRWNLKLMNLLPWCSHQTLQPGHSSSSAMASYLSAVV